MRSALSCLFISLARVGHVIVLPCSKKYLRSTQTVASAFLVAKWPDIGHHNPELGDRVAEAIDPVA